MTSFLLVVALFLLLNVAAFFYRYNDLQVFVLDNSLATLPTPRLVNANDAQVWGLEGELRIRPFKWIELFANAGFLESEYLDFTDTVNTVVNIPTTELIKEVVLPRPLAALTGFHKIAKRRFDDISSVAVAFALDLADGGVTRATIGLGGVAATPIRARDTEAALVGQPWTDETVRRAAEVLAGEGTPIDDHRASSSYRAAMLGQSLLKLHAQHPEGVLA